MFGLPLRGLIGVLAIGMAAVPAAAQTGYPTRPIPLIVPFAAGGPTDVGARIIGEHISRALGQQVIIENIVGAGGTTASVRAMRASPDGYTIEMGHMGTHAASAVLYPNLAYKPDVDFVPIGLAFEQAFMVVARKNFPANDLKEFIRYVKANSRALNMAHAGVGSNSFVYGLVLNAAIGAKPTLVPFSGTGPAMNALVGSQVDYMTDGTSNVVPQLEGGTIKAYAIGTPVRNPALPNVPTAAEGGLPEFQALPWWGLFAPKGTPQPLIDKLTDALDKALDDTNTRRRLIELGSDIPGKVKRGQGPLGALVKSEMARLGAIVNAAGATLN